MIKLKYRHTGYPTKRNILTNHSNIQFSRDYDLFKIPGYIFYKLGFSNDFLDNSHFDFWTDKQTIWHFFNTISFNSTPWVSTFETTLPRWGINNNKLIKKGFEFLERAPCKRLLALSNCTKNIQAAFIKEYFPDNEHAILNKIEVMHPPQKRVINDYTEKELDNNDLIFTIVGGDFFLKGGAEILRIFDHFLEKDRPLKLQIISSLKFGDFASKTTKNDLEAAKRIIEKHKKIIHYISLPNEKVLELLKNTHVALLPTYADTYGYFVLEAQAAGCPVVTTDIRALPEINSNEHGWVIELPKYETDNFDEIGRALYKTKEGREKISKAIEAQLESIILNILDNFEAIKQKGIKSLERIKKDHDPQGHASHLFEIYQEALN